MPTPAHTSLEAIIAAGRERQLLVTDDPVDDCGPCQEGRDICVGKSPPKIKKG